MVVSGKGFLGAVDSLGFACRVLEVKGSSFTSVYSKSPAGPYAREMSVCWDLVLRDSAKDFLVC